MKKVEAIVRPEKLEEIKDALCSQDFKGMTITQVVGCGNQKGQKNYYRGTVVQLNLLPKIKVEIVVDDAAVDGVVKLISDAAKTGKIGDGKIFVSTLDNAVRIRTGEYGDDAI